MPKRPAHMVLGMPIHAIGYHPACWLVPGVPPDGAMSLRHAVNCARIAERGTLDFVFLADTGAVRNLDNPAIAREREHEHVKFEPISLLAALATATTDIGLVGTVSTTYNQPYHLAQALASLDHISKGRAGWNLVTGFAIDEARNFGADSIAPSPIRHARAREFVQVLRGLLDKAEMHRLDHHGPFFDVRGPLDVARPPQDHMPIVTAGYSEEANAFTAEVADMVYAAAPTIEVAREYYADLKNRLPLHGRTPGQLKVLPGIMPFIGRTQMEAEDKFAKLQAMIDPAVTATSGTGPSKSYPRKSGAGRGGHRRALCQFLRRAVGPGEAGEADDTAALRDRRGRLLAVRLHRHAGHDCGCDAGMVRDGGRRRV
jgi:FMN-dependent oxidoreductase (nitrilotriacetate monooxygenase family)